MKFIICKLGAFCINKQLNNNNNNVINIRISHLSQF